ncbi:hypothetical protein N9H43_05980 [Planktomarina temperata]|nr:hypothetical protein [Planktomarina temperata]
MIKNIYIAGPLFNAHERSYLELIAAELEGRGYNCFVPSSLFAAIPRLSAAPSVRTFINAGLVQASAIGQLIGAPLVGFVVARSESWLAAAPLIWGAAGLIFLAAMALRILSKDMPDL